MNNQKLRIAIVSDAIYPYNKGGKEKRIFEISTRLAKSGHEVHIYCMKWWKGIKTKKIENGVTLHAISKYYPLYSGQRRSIKQAIMFSLSCFKLLKEDFDIIDVDHMPHLVLFPLKIVSLLKGKKLYTTWNEVWGREYWVKYMGLSGNIAYIIEWLSARLPDEIISVSEHTKNKLRKELKIKTAINVIPNGINYSEIQKVKPSKTESDVIFAGRLLNHKNVNYLINSIKILKSTNPNIKCLIIGKGPEETNLKELVKKLNLEKNVIFHDFLKDQKDLYALMKSSKVFAFPSTREGFGIVALEANASGIPVITTDHKDNATKDLIKNGQNGYILKLNDKKISEKITKYLSAKKSNNLYAKLALNYDWKNITRKVEGAYL